MLPGVHEALLRAIVPDFDARRITSYAICPLGKIRIQVPHNAYLLQQLEPFLSHATLYHPHVTRCARCDRQNIYQGTAAIELLHYCDGDAIIARERIIFFPRIICGSCSLWKETSSSDDDDARWRVPDHVVTVGTFMRHVEPLVAQAIQTAFHDGEIAHTAERLAGGCAYCERPVHLTSSSSGRLLPILDHAETRDNVDSYVASAEFRGLTYIRAVAEASMDRVLSLRTPVDRFRERVLLTLAGSRGRHGRSGLQFLSTLGTHLCVSNDQGRACRPALSFCSPDCTQRFEHALTQVVVQSLNSDIEPITRHNLQQSQTLDTGDAVRWQWLPDQHLADWFVARVFDVLQATSHRWVSGAGPVFFRREDP